MMDRKLIRWIGILWFVTLSVADNVTTLRLIQGKSKTSSQIHVLLTPGAEACGAEGLCMSSSAAARVFLLIGKLCALSVLPQLNQYVQTLTCKELLHVTDSESSSAQVIDPVGDLLPRSVTACYYFFQIKHFLHVQIDFLVHSACIERPTS